MKRVVLAVAMLTVAAPAFSQVYVHGYTRSDGTYVAPHYRSSPNNTTLDNYSTRGNINPYTGQMGTRNPTPNYSSPFGQSSNWNNSPYGSPSQSQSNCTVSLYC